MKTTLTPQDVAKIDEDLSRANRAFNALYPGERAARQPVHTVYGGAHLFRANTSERLGERALQYLESFAPDTGSFAAAFNLTSGEIAREVHRRVLDKLKREPVEDFRIDFEDGYGQRSNAEEDRHAISVASELAAAMKAGLLPPFIGIRIKPLSEESRARSMRTLDLFLTTLLERSGGALPQKFVVTLPKVTVPQQPAALVKILDRIESALGLAPKALPIEIMIESPQAILNRNGASNLPLLLDACAGRLLAAHFGAYDYSASCGITAAHQHLLHPACDFARSMMQAALAGTGVWLSDGATNILPLAVHRGEHLSAQQERDNRESIYRGWRLHFEHVRRACENGFYQGWDLHPAQLPARYAAVYSFYLENAASAAERLKNFMNMAAQAGVVGNIFDDAATGQGLLNFFRRALNCGALTETEAMKQTMLTGDELQAGSFVRIAQSRAGCLHRRQAQWVE